MNLPFKRHATLNAIYDANGAYVASCYSREMTDFIVKACNAQRHLFVVDDNGIIQEVKVNERINQ
jgi:hypothetical protein